MQNIFCVRTTTLSIKRFQSQVVLRAKHHYSFEVDLCMTCSTWWTLFRRWKTTDKRRNAEIHNQLGVETDTVKPKEKPLGSKSNQGEREGLWENTWRHLSNWLTCLCQSTDGVTMLNSFFLLVKELKMKQWHKHPLVLKCLYELQFIWTWVRVTLHCTVFN